MFGNAVTKFTIQTLTQVKVSCRQESDALLHAAFVARQVDALQPGSGTWSTGHIILSS
jgi:hypothetical protein